MPASTGAQEGGVANGRRLALLGRRRHVVSGVAQHRQGERLGLPHRGADEPGGAEVPVPERAQDRRQRRGHRRRVGTAAVEVLTSGKALEDEGDGGGAGIRAPTSCPCDRTLAGAWVHCKPAPRRPPPRRASIPVGAHGGEPGRPRRRAPRPGAKLDRIAPFPCHARKTYGPSRRGGRSAGRTGDPPASVPRSVRRTHALPRDSTRHHSKGG